MDQSLPHLSTDIRAELLTRPKQVGLPFPVAHLAALEAPSRAIATLTSAPIEIGFQSLLATSALVAQQRANVETLAGETPLSLFLLTVAASGERKSSCDKLAVKPIQDWEEEQQPGFVQRRNEYEFQCGIFENMQRKTKKERCNGEAVIEGATPQQPVAPVTPRKLLTDVTFEGILRHFEEGDPSIGIFADEGGQFFGGHAMSKDNQLKTAAGLSKLWDAAPLNRTRAGSTLTTHRHRRGSLHLMIQPGIAETVFGSDILKDQGLLSRLLIAASESRIGQRLILVSDDEAAKRTEAKADLEVFYDRIKAILSLPVETTGNPLELKLPVLALEPDARAHLITFANEVECQQSEGRNLSTITGFASKAAEQAVRIAGVLTLLEDDTATVVNRSTMHHAIKLTTWYISEAQRLLDAGYVDPVIEKADLLDKWLRKNKPGEPFDKRTIVRCGPNCMRDTATVTTLLNVLEKNGCVVACPGAVIEDTLVAQAWRLNSNA